MPENL